MSLAPGSRIGVYEITAPLGEGGMGQVWRATDTTLGRQVAIKILPDAFASDPERAARFEREAKTLAALNHPHIAAIYGFEKSSGMHALVMELVEGEDLARRIARGAVSFDEALPIARQIAEALEAAHEQGIIHRDLKPANIKVRDDGTVKVLDFGLAKALVQDLKTSGPHDLVNSPTITTPAMTMRGMILGTAAYMSPEQARGKVVDKRSDIWAFGAVLYEMLAGTRPFVGEDATEVIAAVVKTTPDWSALPADLPRPLVTLIQRCLEKDRKARVGDIAVARFLLADSATFGTSSSPGALPRSASSRALPWVTSAAATVFAIAWMSLWAPWREETPLDRPLVRLDVDLGADVSLPAPNGGRSNVAISPDGTRLAFVSGTPTKLFTRRLDQPKATEIAGTQGASQPFFSPDGQWIGFFSGSKANKVSVEGGAVIAISENLNSGGYRGGSWGEDGTIFVGPFVGAENKTGLQRIRGGVPDSVGEVKSGEVGLFSPEILPGGNALLMVADNPGPVDRTLIEVLTLADGRRKTLVRGGASPRYLATSNASGHLVYVTNATMFAIPFDLKTLETRGTAVPVLDDVAADFSMGTGQFDVSRTGALVYSRGNAQASGRTVRWVDPSGKMEPLLGKPAFYQYMSLSPDGARVVLTVVEGGSSDVWVYDHRRDSMTRLTFGGGTYSRPRWSPDGRYVVFSSVGSGLRLTRADGASEPQALTESKSSQAGWSFAPDGKRLAYAEGGAAGQLWTMPLVEQGGQWKAGTPERFFTSRFSASNPSFSPDGRWLAYQSNESGPNEVYVRAFPPPSSGEAGKWQLSNNGGTEPLWSPNGRELMYRLGDQILAAAYAVSGNTFVAEKPRVWIARLGGTTQSWDLAPDGKRVAVVTSGDSEAMSTHDHQVVFLFNFFDELRRKVPLRQ